MTRFFAYVLLLNSPLVAQEATKPTAPPAPTPKPHSGRLTAQSAQKMADKVLKETSVLRGLLIKRPVPCGVQGSKEIEKMVREAMQKENSQTAVRSAEVLMKRLNMAPENFDLKSYYVRLMGEQVAGYYDTDSGKFYTAQNVASLQLETIMAHELTHALQDQHFDLSRLEKWPRHDSDAQGAMQALVEGDATFTMSRYMTAQPLRFLGMIASSLFPQGNSELFYGAPRSLQQSMTFPYIQGMQFVSQLYQKGRWPLVNRAFTKLPASTEHILHPDKYLAGEAPVKVPLRHISRTIGRGWKLVDHDVNGEFGFQLILGEHIADLKAVNRAAAGWGGDRYALYEGPKGATLFAQVSVWDSESDAREFALAYGQRTQIIQGTAGKTVKNGFQWKTPNGSIYIARQSSRVVILEGVPQNHTAEKTARPLWK
jgi:hypothetical protein